MKQRTFKFMMLVVALVMAMTTNAQELEVVEPLHASPFDIITSENSKNDYNGVPCAVVKVQLPVAGVKFEGNVFASEYKVNEYWVYLTKGTKKFRIKCPGYKTLEVFTTDIEPKGLQSNMCYVIDLNAPSLGNGNGNDEEPIPELTCNNNDPVIHQIVKNMVFVRGGRFNMGTTSEQDNDADANESPAHVVSLPDYYIGKYEVTQREWVAVMGVISNNPSKVKGDNLPVDNVRWTDCHDFVQRLNQMTGLNFRLPTEAEWEYAARGGKQSLNNKYSGSGDINDVAWWEENSGGQPHPVGQKAPNELGLYDMSGNVAERCEDEAKPYDTSTAGTKTRKANKALKTLITGPLTKKVLSSDLGYAIRGGSWNDASKKCRVTARDGSKETKRDKTVGFRLAL